MSIIHSSSSTLHCDDGASKPPPSSRAKGMDDSSSIIDRRTKYDFFTRSGLYAPSDPLKAMRTLLSTLLDNDVPGPLMFRLHREFNLELGKGTQFEVLGASKEFKALLKEAATKIPDGRFTKSSNDLRMSVVKRARGQPETSRRPARDKPTSQDTLRDAIADELDFQIQSARSEIDKLCYMKHPNIVDLLGWGLCLDTFEGLSPLNTSIPLLILERAQCNLRELIKSSSYPTISFKQLCAICFDVGNGLGALHRQKIAHGDMKLDNVLLFLTDNGEKRPKWSAKICDFGTAVSDTASGSNVGEDASGAGENTKLLYTGTEGWIPPEALSSKKMSPRMLQFCDLFVYGLIIWCVFIKSPDPPLGEDSPYHFEGQDQFYKDAAKAVRKTWNVPSSGLNRVLQALRGSLREDPLSRDRYPWRYLNYSNYRYTNILSVDESVRAIPQNEETRPSQMMIAAQQFQTDLVLRLKGCEKRLQDLSHIKIPSKNSLKSWFPKLFPINDWQATYESLFERHVRRQGIKEDPSETATFEHTEGRCFELQELFDDLWAASTVVPTFNQSFLYGSFLYGCSRIRSRFKLCCWKSAVPHVRSTPNLLKQLLPSPHDFKTLAWLCRGEIGTWELNEIRGLPEENEELWSWTFRCKDETERLYRLTLFLEKGFYLGDQFTVDGVSKTVFRHFLEKLVAEARNHVESFDDVFQICKHFPRVGADFRNPDDDWSSSSDQVEERRFFYRGESLDRVTRMGQVITGKEEKFPTSALHEAVLSYCYSAVDCLVQTGFFVNARDNEGRTALDLARIGRQQDLEGWQTANIDLIIGLLENHYQSPKNYGGLPLGWEATELENGKTVYTESTISPETCSVTFQTPNFSLLKERRLALGTKNSMGYDQTYHLDLVRFIRRPKLRNEALSPAKSPIYTDEWYKNEISNTKELRIDPSLDRRRWYRVVAMIFDWLYVGFWASQSVPFGNYATLLLFFPLSIFARSYGWAQNVTFVFSVLALAPFASILDFAIFESGAVAIPEFNNDARREGLLSGLFSCVTELSIGVSAILHGQNHFVQAILIGSFLCNNSLVFGGSLVTCGLRLSESTFDHTAIYSMSNMTVYASTLSIILYLFQATQGIHDRDIDRNALFLSRTVAILLLILYSLWLFWRHRTHANLFDSTDKYFLGEIDAHGVENNAEGNKSMLAPLPAIIISLVCILPIVMCSASLVSSMEGRSDQLQTLMGVLVVPIILRLGKHTKAVTFAVRGNPDYAADLSLGFSLHVVLFLGPCLVIAGWIIGQPMTLRFGLVETVVYGITVWVVGFIVANGKSNYLDGFQLLVMYTISVTAILLFHR